MPDAYIHGRDPEETRRLEEQARFVGGLLLDRVVVPRDADRVLDLGCGVGAMTRLLLERGAVHPVGVDRALVQAREAKRLTAKGAATFAVADGTHLPFADGAFDLVYTSWFFEHVPDPTAILREAYRVLASGGTVWAGEVENSTFLVHPRSEALERTWAAFCAQQLALAGDPFIGRKMVGLLLDAGFERVDAWPVTFHVHGGRPDEMRAVVHEFVEILKSGRDAVTGAKRVDAATYDRAIADLAALPATRGATFTYTFIRAHAMKERRGTR
ncbi:MAG TPA: methyltransferase domain-containing protein [bacterium]|nr:methyltransferase domain-containing protein [bacterium]